MSSGDTGAWLGLGRFKSALCAGIGERAAGSCEDLLLRENLAGLRPGLEAGDSRIGFAGPGLPAFRDPFWKSAIE